MDIHELIDEAFKARQNAYATYSHFKVGAALLLKSGKVIHGCNIENASYGLTMCAERVAIFQAYALGYRKEDIEALAIVANTEELVSPCGACRQVFVELLEMNTPIILANKEKHIETTVAHLMPLSFTGEIL